MDPRALPSCLAAAAALVAGPSSPLAGQERPEPCTYAACALRVEPRGFFSRAIVVRGGEGVEVAWRDPSPELEELFQRHDSAASHYASFTTSDRRADWLGRLGTALVVASVVVAIAGRDHGPWAIGLEAGGIAVGFGASFPRSAANRAFSRAVWWYNRSLASGARDLP